MAARPDTAESDALTDLKRLIRDLGDMACIGCRTNTCPACGLAAEITNRVHLLCVTPPADGRNDGLGSGS